MTNKFIVCCRGKRAATRQGGILFCGICIWLRQPLWSSKIWWNISREKFQVRWELKNSERIQAITKQVWFRSWKAKQSNLSSKADNKAKYNYLNKRDGERASTIYQENQLNYVAANDSRDNQTNSSSVVEEKSSHKTRRNPLLWNLHLTKTTIMK